MSTQNKSTVLEMVAYRGTQLIDDEAKKLKTFELTNDLAPNLFNQVYQRTKGTSKKQTILNYLKNEPLFTVLSTADIKNNSLQPLVAILENKSKLSLNNQFTAFQALSLTNLSDPELLNIWLNIIHHMFQPNPSLITDDLIKILRANHVIELGITDIEEFKSVLKSKPLFPKELLDENYHFAIWQAEAHEGNSLQRSVISVDEKNSLKVTQAETMISSLKNILPKVELFQKDFNQKYKTAYDTALKSFEIESAPAIIEYQSSVNASLLSSFERLGDKVAKYTPDNPYLQPQTVTNVSLPKFEFEMERPMDLNHVQQSLSEHEVNLLLYALDYDFSKAQEAEGESSPFSIGSSVAYSEADTLLKSFSDYDQWTNAISNKISELNQQVIENTTVGQSLVKVGSFYIPVTNEENTNPFTFKLASSSNVLQENVSLLFNIPNVQDEIESVSFTRIINGVETKTEITADKFVKKGNALSITDFDKIDRLNVGNIKDGTIYKIDFELANGSVFKVDNAVLVPNKSIGGTIIADTNTAHEDALLEPYIPSGFGIKQLGVADYKRVEQTVKCYEEGEVSHIENIMAREYREKSSRSLKRSENTTTTSKTSEQEQIKDTASTSRFEMQSELSKITREDQSFAANASASYSPTRKTQISASASYANNKSQEESSRQAIQKAQELTERAVNRITTSVLEERINTVIEEYEENNRHGFDNREGENHVVGVYRWVDKLYNNQMVNYGKRMMFEFMIPEPARIHKLGAKNSATIVIPEDPRTAKIKSLSNAGKLDENLANFWAAKYNVQINAAPQKHITVMVGMNKDSSGNYLDEFGHTGSMTKSIELPEGYEALSYKGTYGFVFVPKKPETTFGTLMIGNNEWHSISNLLEARIISGRLNSVRKSLEIAFMGSDVGGFGVSLEIKCQRTTEAFAQWQQETFNAIITAYEEALEKYNEKVSANDGKDKTTPLFYRQIENIALRKNCISYLLNEKVMGGINLYEGNTASTYKVLMKENLDKYASLVKFLEQAFEWDIMSYTFYPYYWANRSEWNNLYQFNESDDALFRSFMQSGMARVVATVRPGFEAAVGWFLQTGKIWNGGETPVINDELYVSVLDEVLETEATEEGEPWITRVPTSLTILQAQSIGLEVTSALPCDCEDEECNSNFKLSEAKLGVTAPTTEA